MTEKYCKNINFSVKPYSQNYSCSNSPLPPVSLVSKTQFINNEALTKSKVVSTSTPSTILNNSSDYFLTSAQVLITIVSFGLALTILIVEKNLGKVITQYIIKKNNYFVGLILSLVITLTLIIFGAIDKSDSWNNFLVIFTAVILIIFGIWFIKFIQSVIDVCTNDRVEYVKDELINKFKRIYDSEREIESNKNEFFNEVNTNPNIEIYNTGYSDSDFLFKKELDYYGKPIAFNYPTKTRGKFIKAVNTDVLTNILSQVNQLNQPILESTKISVAKDYKIIFFAQPGDIVPINDDNSDRESKFLFLFTKKDLPEKINRLVGKQLDDILITNETIQEDLISDLQDSLKEFINDGDIDRFKNYIAIIRKTIESRYKDSPDTINSEKVFLYQGQYIHLLTSVLEEILIQLNSEPREDKGIINRRDSKLLQSVINEIFLILLISVKNSNKQDFIHFSQLLPWILADLNESQIKNVAFYHEVPHSLLQTAIFYEFKRKLKSNSSLELSPYKYSITTVLRLAFYLLQELYKKRHVEGVQLVIEALEDVSKNLEYEYDEDPDIKDKLVELYTFYKLERDKILFIFFTFVLKQYGKETFYKEIFENISSELLRYCDDINHLVDILKDVDKDSFLNLTMAIEPLNMSPYSGGVWVGDPSENYFNAFRVLLLMHDHPEATPISEDKIDQYTYDKIINGLANASSAYSGLITQKTTTESIEAHFQKALTAYKSQVMNRLLKSELSQEKIELFIKSVTQGWESSGTIRKLLQLAGQYSEEKIRDPQKYGFYRLESKEAFVEHFGGIVNYSNDFGKHFGSQLARAEDEYFIRTLSNKGSSEKVERKEVYEKIYQLLKGKPRKNTFLFVTNFWDSRMFIDSNKFERKWNIADKAEDITRMQSFVGVYDGYTVFNYYQKDSRTQVFVVPIKKCKYLLNDRDDGQELNIEINKIEGELLDKVKENTGKSEEELKKNVAMKVLVEFDIEIDGEIDSIIIE